METYWMVTAEEINLNVASNDIALRLLQLREEGFGPLHLHLEARVDIDVHLGFKTPDYQKLSHMLSIMWPFWARVFYIDTNAQFGKRDYFPHKIEEIVNGKAKRARIYKEDAPGNGSAYVLDSLDIGKTGSELISFVEESFASIGLGDKARGFISAMRQLPEPPQQLGKLLVEMHKYLIQRSIGARRIEHVENAYNRETERTNHLPDIHTDANVVFQPLNTVVRTKNPDSLLPTQKCVQQSGCSFAFGPMQPGSYFTD